MMQSSLSNSKSASTGVAASSTGFSATLVEARPGFALLTIEDARAAGLFRDEPGGHRWQRVPPTEKRGRVQTSTITVAIMDEELSRGFELREQDLRIESTKGSGAGGQHRNKTETAIRVTHLPTGVAVRCETERSQSQNKRTALTLLRARLAEREIAFANGARADSRRAQVGSGMRGDKRRTIRERDDSVVDHVTGCAWRYRDYLRGRW